LPANTTSFSHTGLSAGTRYCYKVQARNAAGNSPTSNIACATPTEPEPFEVTGLIAVASSPTRIDLSWLDTDSEIKFKIREKEPGGTWARIGTVGANVTSFSHVGLEPGSTHCYKIQARTPLGSAPASASSCATTPLTGGSP